MTTITDYLESARVSLIEARDQAQDIDLDTQSPNDVAADVCQVVRSIVDALRELEAAIAQIG
jgi:ribulose kinase